MDSLTPIYQAPLLPDLQQVPSPSVQTQQDRKKGRGPDKVSRHARAADAPLKDKDITARDIAVLEAVQRCRVLSSEQIRTLLFAGIGPDQPRARLRKLFHSGYLYRLEMPLQRLSDDRNRPFLYFLDTRGAQLLAERWGIPSKDVEWSRQDRNLSLLYFKHMLLCNDIRVAITRSSQAHNLNIPIWKDDRTMKREHHADPITIITPEGTEKSTWVEPDAYMYLTGETPAGTLKMHRFLEIDRGTESGTAQSAQKRAWNTKILAYLSYYRAGKFHERYYAKGMTVLTITTGKEGRLTTLKEATEAAGGKSRFMFTTLDRLRGADILTDPIFSVAGSEERRSILQLSR